MRYAQKMAYMLIGGLCAALFGGISIAALGDAGSDTDPLVTKSYVEKRLTELDSKISEASEQQIELKMTALKSDLQAQIKAAGTGTSSGTGTSDFVLVQAKAGDTITFGENAQFILRAGLATAIAGQGGGLSDLTSGKDLKSGADISTNHLVLIPKNDGRGVKINYESWLMIKGSYQMGK